MQTKCGITLEDASKNIGREVIYIPYEGCELVDCEVGHIHSVNDMYIFVNFGSRTPGRGEACRPDSLAYTMKHGDSDE